MSVSACGTHTCRDLSWFLPWSQTFTLNQVAEGEAKAGHAGSKALRAAALRALRRLVGAAGDGDVLAFVLPGAASGLLRALLVAGGAAHNRKSIAATCSQASNSVHQVCPTCAFAKPRCYMPTGSTWLHFLTVPRVQFLGD